MSVSNNLAATKIDVGGVAAFGQSLSILHPELSPCAERYSYDQYGRPAPPDSLNTTVCPGMFDPIVRIEVENSLRSYLSPRYFNLPKGLEQGTDTMFGRTTSKGRNYLDTEITQFDANLYKNPEELGNRAMMNAPRSYLHYENHYNRY